MDRQLFRNERRENSTYDAEYVVHFSCEGVVDFQGVGHADGFGAVVLGT